MFFDCSKRRYFLKFEEICRKIMIIPVENIFISCGKMGGNKFNPDI